MPSVHLSWGDVFYAARGKNGAPLIFIHGAGDSHLVWNGQLAALSNITRGFAVDLPGHGRSTGAGCVTILDYALAVRDFLDALSLERAILVGSSMGGAIAQTLALEFPERVRGLGLVGTGAKLRVAPAFLQGLRNDFETIAGVLVENYYAPSASVELKEKSLRQMLATGSRITLGDFNACDAFDMRARIHEILAPTLVLCGRQDTMTPVQYSEFLAQTIPHSRLVVIENAGHMVMLEQPGALNEALRAWLSAF